MVYPTLISFVQLDLFEYLVIFCYTWLLNCFVLCTHLSFKFLEDKNYHLHVFYTTQYLLSTDLGKR